MTKERIDKRRATAGGMHLRAAHAIAHLIALSYREPFMSRHQHLTANNVCNGTSKAWRIGREVCQNLFSFWEKGSTRQNFDKFVFSS